MTDEQQTNESFEEQKAPKRRPSAGDFKPENFNIDDIPVPSDEDSSAPKTHKVVRVVEVKHNDPQPEKEPPKAKKSAFGNFFAGALAGAKEVGKTISAGAKSVTEKKENASEKLSEAKETEDEFAAAEKAAAAKAAAEKERREAKLLAEQEAAKAAAEKEAEAKRIAAQEAAAKAAAEKEAEAKRIAEHDAAFIPDIDIGDAKEEQIPKKRKVVAAPVPEAAPVKAPVSEAPAESSGRKTRPHSASENNASESILDKFKSLPIGVVLGGAAAILVVLVLIIVLATSCNKPSDTPNPNSSEVSSVVIQDETPKGPEELEIKSALSGIADAFNVNNDVVGWLYIPGLSDVDSAVCQDTTSYSYNKRDVTGKYVKSTYWIDGAYYTHKRNSFGTGIDSLSRNTVVFGHSDLGTTNLNLSDDDPTGPLFSQLFNFRDPSFAEKTPYIFFSTADEDYVWEIFSVFYNDKTVDGDLWYIEPSPNKLGFDALIENAKSRSLYDYGIEVGPSDHILTLSTCTVGFGYSTRENYRFVIMAKLIENPEGLLQKNAAIKINADAPVATTFKSEFAQLAATWKPSDTSAASSSAASSASSAASSVSSSATSSN